MVSSRKARQAMLDALDSAIDFPTQKPVIDMGSGWGTLIIALAKKYPQQQVIGYELSWLPWIFSIICKFTLGLNNLTIYRKDFHKADLNSASALLCFLFSSAMAELEKKLTRDGINNIIIVSNSFALPNSAPIKVAQLNDLHRSLIYTYRWQL